MIRGPYDRRVCTPGVEVRQLTNHKGHGHHLYVNSLGWYDGGCKSLFDSDRNHRTNLTGVDLESGEIARLTDLDQLRRPPRPRSSLPASIRRARSRTSDTTAGSSPSI